MSHSKISVIIALGNPGKDYENTRHNVGFIVADQIIKDFNFEKKGEKFKSILYEGMIGTQKLKLIKPQTYMNLSGEATQLLCAFYKIPYENILVITDDYELSIGNVRVRTKGGPGTHNGMKSIINTLKTQEFSRLRIGIGPKPPEMETTGFVLGRFSENELKSIYQLNSSQIVEDIVKDPLKAMNTWNKKEDSGVENRPDSP